MSRRSKLARVRSPATENIFHLKGTKYSIRYFLRKKVNKANNDFDLFGSKDSFKLSSIPYGNNLSLYLLSLQKFSGSYCCTKCEQAFFGFNDRLILSSIPYGDNLPRHLTFSVYCLCMSNEYLLMSHEYPSMSKEFLIMSDDFLVSSNDLLIISNECLIISHEFLFIVN